MTSRRTTPAGPSQSAGRYVRLAVLLLGAYLLLIHVVGFALVRFGIRFRERELERALTPLTRTLTEDQIFTRFLEFIWDPETGLRDDDAILFYSQSEDWRNTATALRIAELEPAIERAEILTPSGDILITSAGTPPNGEDAAIPYAQELPYLEQAATGEITTTRRVQGLERRFYFPMRNNEGEVIAILRLETDPMPFLAIRRLAAQLLIGLAISLLLLVVIYILITRLVRRTIEAERLAGQADRLRAVGTMTAGIAHEIRNPLNIISLEIEELRATVASLGNQRDADKLLPLVNDLQAETERLNDLTKQFLEFTRPDGGRSSDEEIITDLLPIIDDTIRLWEKSINPEKRNIRYPRGPKGLSAPLSANKLRQVILNLLRNADDAIGDRVGEIRIDITADTRWTEISIIDNGPGMNSDIATMIFDPFFTTRAEGTGLGLSLCRSYIEAAGGTIDVYTKVGGPTTFRIRLPRLTS